MFWFVIGCVFFAIAHRALEGFIIGSTNKIRRKFLWDMSTAGFFLLALVGAWVFAGINQEFRIHYINALVVATPLTALGTGFFAYLSYLVYTDDLDANYGSREE